ncbi:hypothetical protein ACN4EK_10715 [Pantanalinema rosaneae CENA516]|uniref:hypothetical protein n=1 Tax=Pantanalinema rosaneae TaxID=1620701 RepID=UPI003D6E769D
MVKTNRLQELLIRFSEPDRSLITAKYLDVFKFPIERAPGRSQYTPEEANPGDFTPSPINWPLDFTKVIDELYLMTSMMYGLSESDRSEGLEKLQELAELILNKTFEAVTILDMPRLFVQLSKEYQVGDSTVRILGLTDEYGYTDEEVIEKVKFSITNDIATRKLEPISDLIYWEALQPEGGEYIEGSLTCTGVVYQAVPEQYVHQHPQSAMTVQVIDGEWQYIWDESHIPSRFRFNGISGNCDYLVGSPFEIDSYILSFSEPERSTALNRFNDLMQFVVSSLRAQVTPAKTNENHPSTILNLKDFTTQNAKVRSDIEDMNQSLVYLYMVVNRLTGDARAVALTKFNELVEIIESVASKMTLPSRSKSVMFVQFAKDYRVGDSTTRIFGVTCDFGYSQEEVMGNITFALNNPETAYIKLGPATSFIEWQNELPEGSEYIEGSFTCTGVVYPSFHDVYLDLCPQPDPLEATDR